VTFPVYLTSLLDKYISVLVRKVSAGAVFRRNFENEDSEYLSTTDASKTTI